MQIDLPADLLTRIRGLVNDGEYPDEETAIIELLRHGLIAKEQHLTDRPPGLTPPDPAPRPALRRGRQEDVRWL